MPLFKSLTRMFSGKAEPAAYLAAFGKHPGWNDHLDDQGLDTEALVLAKRLIYIQGISQNIDSGAWENLDSSERVDHFQHNFLWYMPGDTGTVFIAGRMWSSADGKGRDKYPMVLCSELVALPDEFATRTVLPFLDQVQRQCVAAKSADTVQNVVSHEREKLRGLIPNIPLPAPLTARQLAAVASHSDMHVKREGFHRIIYQFIRALGGYRTPPGKKDPQRRPEHLRLPDANLPPSESLLFWLRLVLGFVDESTPLLLLAPDPSILKNVPGFGQAGTGEAWVDLIVGEPTPASFFCLKAGPKRLPFTSEIPYTIDPALTQAIEMFVDHCASLPEGTPMPPWPALQ